MTNVEFTLEEVCYLESLPAIAHVTSKRITYAHEIPGLLHVLVHARIAPLSDFLQCGDAA